MNSRTPTGLQNTNRALPTHSVCLFLLKQKLSSKPQTSIWKTETRRCFQSPLDSSCIQLTELTGRQSQFYNNQLKPKQTRLKPQSTNHHTISQTNCLGFQDMKLAIQNCHQERFQRKIQAFNIQFEMNFTIWSEIMFISKDKIQTKSHKERFWRHSQAWDIQVAQNHGQKPWERCYQWAALNFLLPLTAPARMENWSQLLL